MRKFLPTLVALCALTFVISCTSHATKESWSLEQRKSMRRALSQYREMVYLDEMSDAEFYIFSNDVTDEIETAYPLYTSLIAVPQVGDTIESFITTVIVEQLDADGSNMSKIYPYRELRNEGRLPAKLNRPQRRAFYKCFARKVNNKYETFDAFFAAVVADTTDKSTLATMEAECAKELFHFPKE